MNCTVNWRRSPELSAEVGVRRSESEGLGAGGGTVRDTSHFPQNWNPAGFSKPQYGQGLPSFAPQRPQKFIPSGLSSPQFGQRMLTLPEHHKENFTLLIFSSAI